MRKRTFVLIIILAFFSWVAVTYHLFLQRPQEKAQRTNKLYQQLEHLENELQEQLLANKKLLEDLQSFQGRLLRVRKSSVQAPLFASPDTVIGVLVFACNRVTIKRNLDLLLKYRPSKKQFPILVSQDCGHEPTTKVIKGYGDQINLIQQPDQSDIPLVGKEKKFKGYYKISRHYGWALNQSFHRFNYENLIIVEDDLDIAPDFFEYFSALQPILKSDPTLWCVSAWNDNGKESLVSNEPELLHRSDFFPGLGWMLTKDLWLELQVKWPKAFWDDWIRQPAQRKERACIRPELSRSKTFGKIGVSNGLFYEKHLKFIKLNDKFVPFTKKDHSYLKKDNYDVTFVKQVYGTATVTLQQLLRGEITHPDAVRITYTSKDTFKRTAKALGMMDDFKSGVPRTGYRGVVSFMFKNRRVYLAPPADWKGYDTTWS